MTYYRIVTDQYAGFEVQSWRWWFPVWVQCRNRGATNTHSTIEEAEAFARRKARGCGHFVKYLGSLKEPAQ